jgi:hypothetical protein
MSEHKDTHGKGHGKPGWNAPLPEKLPEPTYWPAVLGLGATLLPLGIITSLFLTGLGGVLFVLGIGGWVNEMRHE